MRNHHFRASEAQAGHKPSSAAWPPPPPPARPSSPTPARPSWQVSAPRPRPRSSPRVGSPGRRCQRGHPCWAEAAVTRPGGGSALPAGAPSLSLPPCLLGSPAAHPARGSSRPASPAAPEPVRKTPLSHCILAARGEPGFPFGSSERTPADASRAWPSVLWAPAAPGWGCSVAVRLFLQPVALLGRCWCSYYSNVG